ncbi:MAG: cobyrinate a,c-diamide synthase [Rhizobiaceae bacterium]
MAKGFIIAAPHSGSGKTTVTLGLLRALKRRDVGSGPAKAGPDFIDPAFHTIASGTECVNLDPWAMRPSLVGGLANLQSDKGLLVVEAMMGLFDGATDGSGSAADLAESLNLPIVLVVDAAKQSHSIAALVSGFRDFRKGLRFAGVILNRVGSPRHEAMMREALGAISVPVLGSIPRDDGLVLPSRHLGLVQAGEHADIEQFMEHAADVMDLHVDIDCLLEQQVDLPAKAQFAGIAPPAQNISVARDEAFAFMYPHLLQGWREQGASLSFFSPLADEAPDDRSEFIYLPGGYPELHSGKLAANRIFFDGLTDAKERGAFLYGECGGYMVLGEGLVDASGTRHSMAGLLPLVTSFEKRKLNLGYRLTTSLTDFPLASKGTLLSAHEFHYSTVVSQADSGSLFEIADARGDKLGNCGLRRGSVAGSYMHLIDHR